MWSTWFLQNFLKTNLGAWSILFFFIYRLVHSLMTTLERNSLFMLEMTTRVLEGCWITSIKKLFLIFLVESAWYEFKLVHIETYLWVVGLFFFPPTHSSKQRSLLVLVKIQKEAFEEENWIPSFGATVADCGRCVTTVLDLSICCVQYRCLELHLCEGIRYSIRSFISSLWQQDERLAIASVLDYAILWSTITPKIWNILEIQKYPHQSVRRAKALLSPSVAKLYQWLNVSK